MKKNSNKFCGVCGKELFRNTASFCKKHRLITGEHRKRISDANKGKIRSLENRKKYSDSKKGLISKKKGKKYPQYGGKNHYRWIEDRTKLKRYEGNEERRSPAYRFWRQQVWLRDNFKCKIANPDCNGRLEAHHILGYKDHPELRYEINNGITLCHFHHPRKRKDEIKLSPYFQSLVAEVK